DLSEILNLIRRESKAFHGTGDPILYVPTTRRLLYFRNAQISHKQMQRPFQASTRIHVSAVEESQFLADELARPIGHVISFPLSIPRGVLFFEHNLNSEQIEKFLSFIGERLQPVSLAIDRILLEQELRSASRVWEMTFDGLNEPIAILDMNNTVLRA